MGEDEQSGRHRRRWMPVAAGLLVVAGAVALTVGLLGQQNAPTPPASAATPVAVTPTPGPTATTDTTDATQGPILDAATPTALSIPSIGVKSALMRLGINKDRSIQVPPQTRDAKAGWYRYSPSPGELGPSVILGHIDSAQYGPGVFFKLGALKPGASVQVTRSDGLIAVFRVDKVVAYSKNDFPTLKVYGNTDHAALRLITCGGKFNLDKHSYESNTVAYASLVSSHRA